MGEASESDELPRRIDEIDERLARLQAELEADVGRRADPAPRRRRPVPRIFPPPEPVNPPVAAPAPPPAPDPEPPAAAVRDPEPARDPDPLEVMCARLLAATRELLAGYEVALARAVPPAGDEPAVTLRAGPFRATGTVAEFERALRGLPEVADAAVRGYEGPDRAIIEVRLRESAR